MRTFTAITSSVLLVSAHAWAQGTHEGPEAPASDVEPDSSEQATVRRSLERDMQRRGQSARLFYMPVAETVGAYELTLSYEGSLLEERGILSSAGAIALGVGDIAQIDYRHTSAIGIKGGNVPLPSVGVQLKLPFIESELIPAVALAYRIGVTHEEGDATEKVTDVYGVTHFSLPGDIQLHAGIRVSQAELTVGQGDSIEREKRTDWYPAIGLIRSLGPTEAILEVGRAPRFLVGDEGPEISSGLTGRLGLRWRLHPRFSFDASAGYLATSVGSSPNDLVAWDIRLGGEVFVPWGAVACESLSLFCD